MKEPRTALSAVLPGEPRIFRLLILPALGFFLLFSQPAWPQEGGGSPANQAVQTAARSRVPALPSPQGSAASPQSLVSFEGGQLSINATNVSLAEVLFAVRGATGADIDIPMNASSERVTAQLGPGPARKVLSDLLGWSNFDYIIQGSDDDPLAVQSITLMTRLKSATAGSTAAGAPAGPRTNLVTRPEPDSSPSSPAVSPVPATTDVGSADPRADQPSPSPVAQDNSSTDAPSASQPKVQSPATMPWTGGSSASGRTPSDMIQELQQMYQQRRIMQEQQNQASSQRSP